MFSPSPGPPQVVILSPHRDDAAFSCGLLLTRLLRSGAMVHVVNVCTVSDYAPYLPTLALPRVQQVSTVRHEEDRHFLEMLRETAMAGAGRCTMTDLGWQDAPLRREIATEDVLGATERQEEVRALAQALQPFCDTGLVLAPLGFGNHVDHRLVRDAARVSIDVDRLGFYEDLPYACWLPAEERQQGAVELLRHLLPRASEGWNAFSEASMSPAPSLKYSYALCYTSQIAEDVADAMEADAMQMHGAERIHLSPAAGQVLRSMLAKGISEAMRI